jgi:hypothetical protein
MSTATPLYTLLVNIAMLGWWKSWPMPQRTNFASITVESPLEHGKGARRGDSQLLADKYDIFADSNANIFENGELEEVEPMQHRSGIINRQIQDLPGEKRDVN